MLDRLKALLAQVFDGQLPAEGVNESSRLIEDVGMNSIGLIYMAMAVEEAFGVTFDNEDFPRLKTVGDVMTLLTEKGAK